jgi:hypothetical protein
VNNQVRERYRIRLKEIIQHIASRSGRLRPQYGKIDDVFRHYAKYEDILKESMQGKKDDKQKEDFFLDRHKIAAAFCCSVLKAQPINFEYDKSGTPLSAVEESANELCAFLLGLQVIQDFWSARCNENIPDEEKEIYSKPIRTPQPNDSDTTYTDRFVRLLKEEAFKHFDYEHRLFGKTLIFFISHIYFMIESYSYQYYTKAP